MKKLLSALLAALMIAALLTGCGGNTAPKSASDTGASGGTASSAPQLTLIIASNQTDPTNPFNYGLEKFKEVAEEVSGGKISVTVHKGTLGENESELVEKLTIHTIKPVFKTSLCA